MFGKQSRVDMNDKQAKLLPDGVLVATLLNKTTGALQQHLRLNAQTLATYAQVREVILEYHQIETFDEPSCTNFGECNFCRWSFGSHGHWCFSSSFVERKRKRERKERKRKRKRKERQRKRKRKGPFEVARKRIREANIGTL